LKKKEKKLRDVKESKEHKEAKTNCEMNESLCLCWIALRLPQSSNNGDYLKQSERL